MVVVADLVVEGVHHGAHGFLVRANTPGIATVDMGEKTSFNALDNAEISFTAVEVSQLRSPTPGGRGCFCFLF